MRAPLKSIASRWKPTEAWRGSAACQTAMPQGRDPGDNGTLLATVQHYVLWNTFAEATAEHRIRLEDVGPCVDTDPGKPGPSRTSSGPRDEFRYFREV